MAYGSEEKYKETAVRQPVASKLEELAVQVSKHASATAIGVRERLSIVSTPEEDALANESVPQEVWPSYFAIMRGHLEDIDRKLLNIDSCLQHLEL